MKLPLASLVCASLFRHRARTGLTLVSIVAAFLLFGLLDTVRVSLTGAGDGLPGAARLQTGSRLSVIQTLPQSLRGPIGRVDGVAAVSFANWFGGAYQDPHNPVFSLAVAPDYLELFPEVVRDAAALERFARTPSGALVGAGLAKRYGWKVGDRVPLQSTIFPDRHGSKNWQFDVVGILRAVEGDAAGQFDNAFLLNWTYFDDVTPYNQGQVGWFVTRLADVNAAARVSRAIDALSANSDHETRTQTEQAASLNWIRQLADIGLIVESILGAVFFTLLLLVGNTMMQAVRERRREFAVLKAIGFSGGQIFGLVLAESVLLMLLGGLAGIGLAAVLTRWLGAEAGGLLGSGGLEPRSVLAGVALILGAGGLVAFVPCCSAIRLNVVDALAGR